MVGDTGWIMQWPAFLPMYLVQKEKGEKKKAYCVRELWSCWVSSWIWIRSSARWDIALFPWCFHSCYPKTFLRAWVASSAALHILGQVLFAPLAWIGKLSNILLFSWGCLNLGVKESLGLGKASRSIRSNLWQSSTVPTKPHRKRLHLLVCLTLPGMVTPPLSWAACSSAQPLFK